MKPIVLAMLRSDDRSVIRTQFQDPLMELGGSLIPKSSMKLSTKLHATIMYSMNDVSEDMLKEVHKSRQSHVANADKLEIFGSEETGVHFVLRLANHDTLTERHKAYKKIGCEWKHGSYKAHVTLFADSGKDLIIDYPYYERICSELCADFNENHFKQCKLHFDKEILKDQMDKEPHTKAERK